MPTLIRVSRPSTRAERVDTNMTASATMPAANAAAPVKKNSNFQAIVKRLFQNRGAVIGLIIFIVLALAAIFAPVAAPYGYEEMDLTNMLSGPSLEHLFGTDELGRDVFSRIIYGGRYSLSIGLAATAFGAVVGCAIGAITGYFGGTLDTVLMRFLDILEAIPGLLLTICVSAVLGSGFDKTILALAITSIPQYVRLLRAQVFSVRDEEYLEAVPHYHALCSTELPLPGYRQGNDECCPDHPDSGLPELCRPGCAAAHSGMGRYAFGWPRVHPQLSASDHVPGHFYHDHCPGPEPVRRRSARRP